MPQHGRSSLNTAEGHYNNWILYSRDPPLQRLGTPMIQVHVKNEALTWGMLYLYYTFSWH